MPPSPSSRTKKKPVPEPESPDDLAMRQHLVSKILEKTGFKARDFQISAAKAVLDGRDVVVHAGTGSGKTLIFAAPHFILENKVSIVISPLILLQQDQQERMRKLGLRAIALNKEVHIEPETWKDLAQGKFEIVLLSPEMALHNEDVRKVFDSEAFRQALVAIHVDEAHTISLWGGDFRKDYSSLGRLRARLPKGVPATLVSATLRPNVKQDAMSTLGFPSDETKYTDASIGNERSNVYVGTRAMEYPASSFKDILLYFDPDETDPDKIPPTIIYIDNVNDVTLAVIALYDWLHPSLRGQELVMPVHAWMTPKYRSEAMEKFASGKVKVIIATEAAGMGCDISNIKRVIQFGICGSIDAFMQRIGRVWCGPDGKGEGWLIYERWVPGCGADKARNDKGKAPANKKGRAPANSSKTQAAGDADKSASTSKTERKCDRLVQELITEPTCRRQYLNRVYKNPKSKTTVPPQDCCDLCDPNSATRIPSRRFPTQQQGLPRAARVLGQSNPDMLACLRTWRAAAFPSAFGVSRMFGASALISDSELERISRCAPVPSIDRLRSYLVKWTHIDSQLESMWEALKAGGFALPVGPTEAVASTSQSTTHLQPTPGPSTVRKPSDASKSRGSAGKASKTQAKASVPGNSTQQTRQPQTPVAEDRWWRGYAGLDQNYKRRNSSMDDLRQLLAGKTEAGAQGKLTQHTRPSVSSPPAKRLRLNNEHTPVQAPRELSPVPSSSSALPAASLPARSTSTFQAPAQPVGRMIVPSQRPRHLPLKPTPLYTPGELRRSYRATLAAQLRHPQPIKVNDFTQIGVPCMRAFSSCVPPLYRPPNPQPPP